MPEGEHEQTHHDVHHSRDEVGDAPCDEGCRATLLDGVEDERHDELCGTTAHVSPPSREPIDGADDLAIEHGAHPVLARHERREGEADEEADGDVPRGIIDERHAEDGGRGEHDEEGAAVARAEEVAYGAHDEPGEDGPGHGRHPGVADVGLGEVEVVADDGHEGRRGEGGDEAREEGDPREVECAHVGVGEGEQLEGLGLVLRVHRQRELAHDLFFPSSSGLNLHISPS